MAGEDFVYVQLSEAGVAMAGESGTVEIVIGRGHFIFKAGESQRVTAAYDWNVLLQDRRVNGQPIFELAPEPPAADADAIPAATKPTGAVVAAQHSSTQHAAVMAPGVPGVGVQPQKK